MRTLPHFLGIGAQKAGTSWLHASLRRHPEVWLPPVKEIHYFDRDPSYPSPCILYPDNPLRRLFVSGYWGREYRRRLIRAFRGNWRHGAALCWHMKYLLTPVNERWYARLFREGRYRIRGEFTPAYAMLRRSDVLKVRRIMPDLRIIYTLRNPVERAWSHFKMLVKRGELRADMTPGEFQAWIDSPEQELRGDYRRTYETWGAVFGRDRIYIGFYDDIVASPEQYLRGVLAFIGAADDPGTVAGIAVKRRINASLGLEIPCGFLDCLLRKYETEMALLADELGGAAANWLAGSKRKSGETTSFAKQHALTRR